MLKMIESHVLQLSSKLKGLYNDRVYEREDLRPKYNTAIARAHNCCAPLRVFTA